MSGRKVPELIGKRFERLLVLNTIHIKNSNGIDRLYFECKCDCGNVKKATSTQLTKGNIKSCGCYNKELHSSTSGPRYKHGHTSKGRATKIWNTFYSAKKRCTNPNSQDYKNYGGRGIEFRFESVEQLSSELGEAPSKHHSIDRIDNEGHYEPGNVKWSTSKEQVANQRPRDKTNCSSKYVGVSYHKYKKKWSVTYKSKWRGDYETEEDAARARSDYILVRV